MAMVPNRMEDARETRPTHPSGMYFLNACTNAGTISATSLEVRVVAVEISIFPLVDDGLMSSLHRSSGDR